MNVSSYSDRAFCRQFSALAGADPGRRHHHHLGRRRIRQGVASAARRAGLRVDIDLRNEKINYKSATFAGQDPGAAGGRQEGSETHSSRSAGRQRRPDRAADGRGHRCPVEEAMPRTSRGEAGRLMAEEQELPAFPIRAYQLIPDPNQPDVVALAIETDQGHSLFWPRARSWKISARLLERAARMPLKARPK